MKKLLWLLGLLSFLNFAFAACGTNASDDEASDAVSDAAFDVAMDLLDDGSGDLRPGDTGQEDSWDLGDSSPMDLPPDLVPEPPSITGQIVITEFMAQSQGGTDKGEWIELYNASEALLVLNGCSLYDGGADNHQISGNLRMNPGDYVVLAKSAASDENHGLLPDYIYSNFSMDNMGDRIVLECEGEVIDEVTYTPLWITLGRSTQLSLSAYDSELNDDLSAWCEGTKIYGNHAKLGTPGEANNECPPLDPCVPNPCQNAPSPGCAEDGTTLQVFTAPGVCNSDNGTYSCDFPFTSVNCAAQEKVCMNGTCEYPLDPCLPNPCTASPNDFCAADGHTLHSFASVGTCTNVGGGPSCSYEETVTDCALDDMICESASCKYDGQGSVPTSKGQFLITEFMARAKEGTDPAEWVELYNNTNQMMDLGGCILKDNGTDAHTINGALIVQAHSYVVLAKSDDPALNYGLSPDYVLKTQYGAFSLNNTADEIVLRCSNLDIDRVIYTSSWVVLGVAMQLSPEAMTTDANDLAENWCEATMQYGNADKLGTPGLPNSDCPEVIDPCAANPCTEVPASDCAVDGLTVQTYHGVCTPDGANFQCSYPVDTTTDCSLEGKMCESGACVAPPDPCDPNPCSEGLAPDCDESGVIARTYNSIGTCEPDGEGGFLCDYSLAGEVVCSTLDMICEDGACVAPPDLCDPNPCTEVPTADCAVDGLTVQTYHGVCTPDGTNYQCSYPVDTTADCSLEGKVCNGGLCE